MELFWIIVVLVIVAVICSRGRSRGKSHRKSHSDESSQGQRTRFLPPIPKGYQIFSREAVAGIQHRREDAQRFARSSSQTLALERELGNPHDANAIKVIGLSQGARFFIGYVPKETAEQIVGSALMDSVQPRLTQIYRFVSGICG